LNRRPTNRAATQPRRGLDHDEAATFIGVSQAQFEAAHQADLDIEGDGQELLYFRSRIVLASRLAGLQPPVDGVSTALDDPARIEADALHARRLAATRATALQSRR
jgi:citrate lyase subunit beta/citryl-CoA lyase